MSRFSFTVESRKSIDLLLAVSNLEMFKSSNPSEVEIDHQEKKIAENWFSKISSDVKKSMTARWVVDDGTTFGEIEKLFDFYTDTGVVGFQANDYPVNIDSTLSILRGLPFEVAASGSLHSWEIDFNYYPPGFASRHATLGWGCAFKGEGHNRLVSRRYLMHGPWRVIRDEEHDITLIQFHDLEADAKTAMEQAKPGHDRMAKPLEGGFIQKNVRLADPDLTSLHVKGLYSPEEKMLRIVVAGGLSVSKAVMLDMCKLRYYQLLESQPLERIAFVFMLEDEARAQLQELWLHELECWTIIKGTETRLDLDYTPPSYEKPEWVQRLENDVSQ